MIATRESVNRVKLYLEALRYLDQDASPFDEAPDEYGCADSLSKVICSAFPKVILGSISTKLLYEQLSASPSFKRVKEFLPGDVIISPTGYSKEGSKMKNGHCGIIGEAEEIMSNSSATGLWTNNYTMTSWVKRYRDQGGYPIYIFRKI